MKRLRKFLKSKSNWPSTIVLIIALAAAGISFVPGLLWDEFAFQIIAVMFAIIAVENFFKQITYMEDIKGKLGEIKPQTGNLVEIKARRQCDSIHLALQEARHEIFISGVNMSSLLSNLGEGIMLRPDITVRILTYNVHNPELLKAYEAMIGDRLSGGVVALDSVIDNFSGYDHVEIRKINSIMPVLFVGYDMDKPHGYIKAEHLFNNWGTSKHPGDLPNIELRPDKEWYEQYRNQIKHVWNRAGIETDTNEDE